MFSILGLSKPLRTGYIKQVNFLDMVHPFAWLFGCALRFRVFRDFIPRLPLAADMPFLPVLHNLMTPGHHPTILG